MPHKYKLTYFNLHGRAEIIRWIFAVAGVEFEDKRITGKEWLEMRKVNPTIQLPLLEFDGVKLIQPMAIARYLARKFGLVGNTPVDEAKADAIVDFTTDIIARITQVSNMWLNPNSQEKAEKYEKEILEEHLVITLKKLEELASTSGHFVGDELSWADLAVVQLKDWFVMIGSEEDYSGYPKLKKIDETVNKNPRIKAWLKKRHEDAFEREIILEAKSMEKDREMEREEKDVKVKLTDEKKIAKDHLKGEENRQRDKPHKRQNQGERKPSEAAV